MRSSNLRRHQILAALFCGALLALPGSAAAARWATLAGPQKGATSDDRIELDLASLQQEEDHVRAWHRETYARPRLPENWAFTYGALKQHSEFDCARRTATLIERIFLAADGSVLKRETTFADDLAGAQSIVPETPLEIVFSRACQSRKPKAEPTPAQPEPAPPDAAAVAAEAKPLSAAARRKAAAKAAAEAPPAPPKPPSGAKEWSHEAGANGPENWASLSTDYAACAGSRQSPIDVRAPISADLPAIRFSWQTIPLTVIDSGHAIEVDATGGGFITLEGEDYEFERISFHLPAEEMSNGKRAPMGVHFIHRSKAGKIAILAVPLTEGSENRLLRQILTALPLEPKKPKTVEGLKVDPGLLIPRRRDYSTYVGSLTAPPCSEGVLWLILQQPMSVSKEQLNDFAKAYRQNARPIQPGNGRIVKSSRRVGG